MDFILWVFQLLRGLSASLSLSPLSFLPLPSSKGQLPACLDLRTYVYSVVGWLLVSLLFGAFQDQSPWQRTSATLIVILSDLELAQAR